MQKRLLVDKPCINIDSPFRKPAAAQKIIVKSSFNPHKLHIEAESQVVGDKNVVLRDCAGMLLHCRHPTMLNVLSCTLLLLTSCSEQMTHLANPQLPFSWCVFLRATRITVHIRKTYTGSAWKYICYSTF